MPADTKKQAFWREHIEQWSQTSLSQAAYCREHGLRKSHFWYWKRRVRELSTEAAVEPLRFLPIDLSPPAPVEPPTTGTGITLVLKQGVRVTLGAEFCPATLRRLLGALGHAG